MQRYLKNIIIYEYIAVLTYGKHKDRLMVNLKEFDNVIIDKNYINTMIETLDIYKKICIFYNL